MNKDSFKTIAQNAANALLLQIHPEDLDDMPATIERIQLAAKDFLIRLEGTDFSFEAIRKVLSEPSQLYEKAINDALAATSTEDLPNTLEAIDDLKKTQALLAEFIELRLIDDRSAIRFDSVGSILLSARFKALQERIEHISIFSTLEGFVANFFREWRSNLPDTPTFTEAELRTALVVPSQRMRDAFDKAIKERPDQEQTLRERFDFTVELGQDIIKNVFEEVTL